MGYTLPVFSKSTDQKVIEFAKSKLKPERRAYWVDTLIKIASPVLRNLSQEKLKATMPMELNPTSKLDRSGTSRLEAFSRLMAGIAPWLELGPDESPEGKLRAEYIELSRKSIAIAVDPKSPDYLQFNGGDPQILVDTAFLAHALIRAPKQLWEPLDSKAKSNVIEAFKSTRRFIPVYNNWLLFMATIEAFLVKNNQQGDTVRIDYAIKKHMEWYKGDSIYGDGESFHWDYYNSFVIHPMLLDIVKIITNPKKEADSELYATIKERAIRYALIQERLISPEGTFPPIGRSLAYRFGAFQNLAQIALWKQLPSEIKPAQVRGALSAVINRMIEAPGTFDKNGWLTIGFAGHQPSIAERYISTGSLYLCSVGLLPLGLPPTDPFWTDAAAPWTSVQAWKGIDLQPDHAIAK